MHCMQGMKERGTKELRWTNYENEDITRLKLNMKTALNLTNEFKSDSTKSDT